MNNPDAIQFETPNLSDTPATTFERFMPPRLGIIHLLIWMTVTAVLLKLMMASKISQLIVNYMKDAQQYERVISIGIGTITIMLLAAGLVGMGVIAIARMRGSKGRLQPGHWLLVAYTLTNVVTTVYSHIVVSVMHTDDGVIKNTACSEWLSTLSITTSLFCLAIMVGICLWAAFRSKGGWQWTMALCLLAMIPLSRRVMATALIRFITPQSLSIIPSLFFCIAITLIVLIAVIIDLYKGERRDWIHWTGVAIVGGNMLFDGWPLLYYVLTYGL